MSKIVPTIDQDKKNLQDGYDQAVTVLDDIIASGSANEVKMAQITKKMLSFLVQVARR